MRPSLPELPYTAQRGERLSNWLALLALLAAGIVWTPPAVVTGNVMRVEGVGAIATH
jgi:hypothetical protein